MTVCQCELSAIFGVAVVMSGEVSDCVLDVGVRVGVFTTESPPLLPPLSLCVAGTQGVKISLTCYILHKPFDQ